MRQHLESLSPISPTPLEELLPGSPQDALSFMQELLHFKPSARLSAAKAMDHSFFDGMANRTERVTDIQPVDAATVDFEHGETRLSALRRKLLGEIEHYSKRSGEGGSSSSGNGNGGSSSSSSGAANAGPPAATAAAAAPPVGEAAAAAAAAAAEGGGNSSSSSLPPAKRPRRTSRERVAAEGPSHPMPSPIEPSSTRSRS